jgi:hypothetical protein
VFQLFPIDFFAALLYSASVPVCCHKQAQHGQQKNHPTNTAAVCVRACLVVCLLVFDESGQNLAGVKLSPAAVGEGTPWGRVKLLGPKTLNVKILSIFIMYFLSVFYSLQCFQAHKPGSLLTNNFKLN